MVRKKADGDDAEIKTPFAKMRVRSANCIEKQREAIAVNDTSGSTHTTGIANTIWRLHGKIKGRGFTQRNSKGPEKYSGEIWGTLCKLCRLCSRLCN